MELNQFDDLLLAARTMDAQGARQRLLLLFAVAELPDDASPAQKAEFEAGHGGALVPAMCVDKDPQALDSFAALERESQALQTPWHMLFVSTLSGTAGQPPAEDRVETALNSMVNALRSGQIGNMLAFDRSGQAVQLN